MTIQQIGSIKAGKSRAWCFEDMRGRVAELKLKAGADADMMCCKLVERYRVPMKCYPQLIESSSGNKRGEIITL